MVLSRADQHRYEDLTVAQEAAGESLCGSLCVSLPKPQPHPCQPQRATGGALQLSRTLAGPDIGTQDYVTGSSKRAPPPGPKTMDVTCA